MTGPRKGSALGRRQGGVLRPEDQPLAGRHRDAGAARPGCWPCRGSSRRTDWPGARRVPSACRPAGSMPSFITAMRSQIVLASSWSWVTKIVVSPSRCCRSRSSRRTCTRILASRLESGSSSSSTLGSMAMVRATRDALLLAARELRRAGARRDGRGRPGRAPARPGGSISARGDAALLQAEGDVAAPPSYAATAHRTGTPCRHRASTAAAREMSLPPSSTRPVCGLVEAGDQPQQRGLAAARGAEEGEELAGADRRDRRPSGRGCRHRRG